MKRPQIKLNNLSIIAFLFIALFVTIALSPHKVFITPFSYSTGGYSNFLTYFLYLSDFIVFSLILYTVARNGLKTLRSKSFWVPLLCLLLIFLANISHLLIFNLYWSAKILEFYFLAWAIASLWDDKYRQILISFVIFGLFEVVISILQFHFQHDLGLRRLGESYLNPNIDGVAKIVLHGKRLIRPYGTFPHPNPLSAFLIFALFITIFFRTRAVKPVSKMFYEISLIPLTFGIFLTFSRASLIALIISIVAYIVLLHLGKSLNKRSLLPLVTILLAAVLSFGILRPYLTTRETLNDQGADLRILYNKIGFSMLKSKPIQGFGPGTSMLHMEQFAPRPLQSWEVQPIHNYYLLAVVELGLVGGLALLYAIFFSFLSLIKKTIKKISIPNERIYYRAMLIAIFVSFAILMLFDHYFYTLQQTQLLLWLLVGLIAAEVQTQNHL
jgi:O-antigen ligase